MIRTAALTALLGAIALDAAALPLQTAPRIRSDFSSASSSRIRDVQYSPNAVVELRGHKGYTLDLQWAEGETFVSMISGIPATSGASQTATPAGISYDAERNVLSLKPLVPRIDTNLTVFTNRRIYRFDYVFDERRGTADRISAIRFVYPEDEAKAAVAKAEAARLQTRLASPAVPRNNDYWFCGAASLRPESAWDDGAQTHLRFAAGTEFPAIFAQSEDGSESLVNLNVAAGDDVVLHRIAKRFVLRRGDLVGCIVNKSPGGVRLPAQTTAAGVERVIKEAP